MITHALSSETHRHLFLREELAAAFPDADEDTLRDTLEGLSELPEMIAAVVRSELEDRALAKGLKGRIGEMEERLGRFEQRAGKKREMAREAMEQGDLQKITEPDFTVSLRSVQPPLVIVEEKEIPDEFCRSQPASSTGKSSGSPWAHQKACRAPFSGMRFEP